MRLSPDQTRALELLADSPRGCTEAHPSHAVGLRDVSRRGNCQAGLVGGLRFRTRPRCQEEGRQLPWVPQRGKTRGSWYSKIPS
jgi:hypothetical protein